MGLFRTAHRIVNQTDKSLMLCRIADFNQLHPIKHICNSPRSPRHAEQDAKDLLNRIETSDNSNSLSLEMF